MVRGKLTHNLSLNSKDFHLYIFSRKTLLYKILGQTFKQTQPLLCDTQHTTVIKQNENVQLIIIVENIIRIEFLDVMKSVSSLRILYGYN